MDINDCYIDVYIYLWIDGSNHDFLFINLCVKVWYTVKREISMVLINFTMFRQYMKQDLDLIVIFLIQLNKENASSCWTSKIESLPVSSFRSCCLCVLSYIVEIFHLLAICFGATKYIIILKIWPDTAE